MADTSLTGGQPPESGTGDRESSVDVRDDRVGNREDSAGGADVETGTRRVGVLSLHNSKETKAIVNAASALGHDPVWVRDENVTARIADGTVRVSPDVDVLINRLLATKSDHPFEDLQLAALYADRVPVVNPPGAVATALHKFRAGAKLAEAGLPVPDAYLGRSPATVEAWPDHLPGAAAHKPVVGTNGRAMARVSPGDPVSPTVRNSQSFLQEFLDAGGDRPADVRVYVVGDRVVGAMRRRAPAGEWRTNVALGGEVTDVTADLGERPRRVALDAVDVLGLDVAGVDLLPADGEWHVLEVNATAGFRGLYDATGVSPAPYIVRLAVERAGGTVPESRLPDVAADLDDSVPDCKPESGRDGASGVLGYTTRVRVSGTDGAESAVAKADTGARRTSVDTELAGRVGAGPLVGTTRVRSTGGGDSETRPLVDLDLRIDGAWRTVTASVADRGEMSYPIILGRDVLDGFRVDVGRRVEEE